MKYPGKPEDPPTWYRERGQSHIEMEFTKELGDLANSIEAEHWFGDQQKHSRYRVDFLLKDARLIVELDGHEYHSTKEQLERDAIRQRYLTRAGYTVIRFTGREVVRSPAGCVSELRSIYMERMQRAPAKYRAMYVDYVFLYREMNKAYGFYKKLYPDKSLILKPWVEVIPYTIQWLHEKSFVTAFIFHSPDDSVEVERLNGLVKEFDQGEIRINTIGNKWYSLELGDHMKRFAHLFDEFCLVADDPIYIEPFRAVLPKEFSDRKLGSFTHQYLANGKLLRRGNDETAYASTELAQVLWQNIWYPIGASLGLSLHEL
jgi:very-short-patch-repair endonuclease